MNKHLLGVLCTFFVNVVAKTTRITRNLCLAWTIRDFKGPVRVTLEQLIGYFFSGSFIDLTGTLMELHFVRLFVLLRQLKLFFCSNALLILDSYVTLIVSIIGARYAILIVYNGMRHRTEHTQ